MRRALIAFALSFFLGSCAAQLMAAAEQDCQRFGFQLGTSEYAACVQQQYNRRNAAFQSGLQQMGQTGGGHTSAPTPPQPYYNSPATMTCFYRNEYSSGFNKVCNYDCLGSPYAITQSSASLCPMNLNR